MVPFEPKNLNDLKMFKFEIRINAMQMQTRSAIHTKRRLCKY